MDSSGMDGGMKQAVATALGTLAVPTVLWDVGDQARIEHALAIVRRIKATIEVEMGASEVQPDLFGHLLQGFQTLRQQYHVRLMDGSNRQGSQDIAMVVGDGDDLLLFLVFVAGVANSIAPFLATGLVPSPCSTRTSSCFSSARCSTLAMNACSSDPSSAHVAKAR